MQKKYVYAGEEFCSAWAAQALLRWTRCARHSEPWQPRIQSALMTSRASSAGASHEHSF